MSADDERGKALAELARQVVLWLQDNELPNVKGFKGVTLDKLMLFAGIYRRVERTRGLDGISHLLTHWAGSVDPKANHRLASLDLDIDHVLFITDPNEEVLVGSTDFVNHNRILLKDSNTPIERSGALFVAGPRLDSVSFEDKALANAAVGIFAAILRRTDPVWDDAKTAAAAKFRYQSIFDFEMPRVNYDRNIRDIVVPDELKVGLPANSADVVLAKRVKEFREYLYYFATYRNRRRNKDEGADHYDKWLAKTPLSEKDRRFHPTLLSEDFLKDCFTEHLMKKDENYLYLQMPDADYVYWLRPEDKSKQTNKSKHEIAVEPLLRLDKGASGAGRDPD